MTAKVAMCVVIMASGASALPPDAEFVVGTGSKSVLLPTPNGNVECRGIGSDPSAWARIGNDGTIAMSAKGLRAGTSQLLSGSWIWRDGDLKYIAMQGELVPGIVDGTYTDVATFAPVVMENGSISFISRASGPTIARQRDSGMFWASPSGQARVVAGLNQPVSGMDEVTQFGFPVPHEAPGSRFHFTGTLFGPGAPHENEGVLWQVGPDGDSRVVVRESDDLRALQRREFLDNIRGTPTAGQRGRTYFSATLVDDGQPLPELTVWRETEQGHRLVVRQGRTRVPGFGDGTVFLGADMQFAPSGRFAAIRSNMSGPTITPSDDTGLWGYTPQHGFELMLREGQPISATDTRTLVSSSGGNPAVNDRRQVLVRANLLDGAVTRSAMLLGGRDGFDVLMQADDTIPGLPTGVRVAQFGAFVMNARGDVLMNVTLTGAGVSASNDLALITIGFGMLPSIVVREGELYEVAPGQFAPITGLTGSNQYESLHRGSLNDHGQFVYAIGVDGHFRGLMTSRIPGLIPSPGSALALLAIIGIGASRRRREPAHEQVGINPC